MSRGEKETKNFSESMQKQAEQFEEKLYFVQHNDPEDIARITEELNVKFENAMKKAAVSFDTVK
jgi:hypothetical protein